MERIINHPILQEVEEQKKVKFSFDGVEYWGYENEMVSSALFANKIKTFSIHPKDGGKQGIFCANGQCSQCTVLIDGMPLKSCVTALREGMDIRTLDKLPKLPEDDHKLGKIEKINLKTDIVVIGAGPAGLMATIELAKLGFEIILVEDKDKLGGKLLLQTHKFFGSEEDCYAGTRGYEIGNILEKEIRSYSNVKIFTESSVVGVYKDQKIGVFLKNKQYALIDFEGLVVSSGARERSLVFPGNELPGVYGAGAFQTLVNRDLVKASDRVFIIGSGNVGLIGAYHALQAGIIPVGICEIMDHVNGYKVHGDKIRRMGVPLYLNHTVISVEGDGKVERVTIAEVDKNFSPILKTAKTFEVDTVLVATGLSPVDEYYHFAEKFGYKVVKAGDASEIAEASSAMFGGKIAGLKLAKLMGKEVVINQEFYTKADVLKSRPGQIHDFKATELTNKFKPIFHCLQEIPCNPCMTVCPKNAITPKEHLKNIMDIPEVTGECIGCGMCVAVCPGLAISLAKELDQEFAELTLPYEFNLDFKKGDLLVITDMEGEFLEEAEFLRSRYVKKYKTHLVTVKMHQKNIQKACGIKILEDELTKPLREAQFEYLPDNGLVCRCERVSVKEIVAFIKEYHVRDINHLKQIRVGMGACGSKTCSVLLPRIFSKAGVDYSEVQTGRLRPLSVEIPMQAIVNESEEA